MIPESKCYISFSKLKFNVLVFPLFVFSFIFGYYDYFIISFLSAVIHECSHMLAAHLSGIGTRYVKIQPFGICANLDNNIIRNPYKEMLIVITGPIISIIIGIIFQKYRFLIPQYSQYIFYCNITLGIFNLMPTLPLDGGRFLHSYLSTKIGYIKAYDVSILLSKIIIIILITVSVLLIVFLKFNISFIIIIAFLLSNICYERNNIARFSVQEIFNRSEKIKKQELKKSIVLTSSEDTLARKIIRNISSDKYCIVKCLDKNEKIIKTLSEGEIITAIYEKGINIKLKDI